MDNSSTDLLITNTRLYGEGEPVDVLISSGVISDITPSKQENTTTAAGADVIDGEGKILLPGFVDLYAELGEPGAEHAETIETGTRAAAKGGYTAVCAAPSGSPLTGTQAVAEFIWYKAKANASCDVFPLATLTQDRGGEQLTEFGLLQRSEAQIPMFTDGTKTVSNSSVMHRALEYCSGIGATVAAHCEDASLTAGAVSHEGVYSGQLGLRGAPRAAEDSAIARDLYLARDTGARLHLRHVSTTGAVELLSWARSAGINVTAEVTPYNLYFNDSVLETFDSNFKVNPPIRSDSDVEALRRALLDGIIDCVVSDHAPRPDEEKACEFELASPGMTSLETAFAAVAELFVVQGEADWRFIARVFSERPAKVAGLTHHGRPLEVGEAANLTLVDPDCEWAVEADEFASLSRNNPFVGESFHSRVAATIRSGEVTYQV